MRIVVLGGTRFIGRAITEELAGAGHELLLIHRGRSELPRLRGVEHLHAERAELADTRDRIAAYSPEAAIDTYAMSRADAEAGRSALPDGLPTVVLSSADVYRAFASIHDAIQTEPVPIDERAAVRERRYPYRGQVIEDLDFDLSSYEKLEVEEVYLRGGGVVLRLPFVYGEHDHRRREEFILRRVRAGRTRIPIGPGTWLGSRAYVREVARAVRLCAALQLRGEVLNLAESPALSLRLWAERILAAAGSDAELVEVPEALLPDDSDEKGTRQHLLLAVEKAREMLGWEHEAPEQGIGRSVRWHLDNPPPGPDDGDFSADDRALAGAAPG